MVRRELGEGRWDKILMKRMVELSDADNYEEAKEEWIATGDVWWSGNGEVPNWVTNSNHPNQCLCGHNIVYHFRIRNTITNAEEIVGSDHINSYLIMRQIAQEQKKTVGEITDAEVERWLKERVGSMKAEAWWAENGDSFSSMFNKVKELDIFLNARNGDYYWNGEIGRNYPRKILRKKGKGKPFTSGYKMASIVWRWNHPDNPKNQLVTRGIPTDKLMQDLSWLYVMYDEYFPILERHNLRMARLKAEYTEKKRKEAEQRAAYQERQRIAREERAERERIAREKWEAERPAREAAEKARREEAERQQKILEAREIQEMRRTFNSERNDSYKNNCRFLGLPILSSRICNSHQEYKTLYRFILAASEFPRNLGGKLPTLKRILEQPATEEQYTVLEDLGLPKNDILKFKIEEINRIEAEKIIEKTGEKE